MQKRSIFSLKIQGNWSTWDLIALLAIAGGALIATPFISGFYQYTLAVGLIYGLASLGSNVAFAHAGAISVGQGAFVAVGAYSTVDLASKVGLPLAASIALGACIGCIVSAVVGLPALRLRGHFFPLLTFAVGYATIELASDLTPVTGGTSGLTYTDAGFTTVKVILVLIAIIVVVGIHQMRLLGSTFGNRLRLLRDSEKGAASIGINVGLYRGCAFAYSGFVVSLAGAFFGPVAGFLSPDVFTVWISVYILLGVILGGMRWCSGALAGGILLGMGPQVAGMSGGSSQVTFGVLVLVVVLGGKVLPRWIGLHRQTGAPPLDGNDDLAVKVLEAPGSRG